MDLISNCNVGNVYTDIKVYNKLSFCSKINRKRSRFITSLLKNIISDLLVINLLLLTYFCFN